MSTDSAFTYVISSVNISSHKENEMTKNQAISARILAKAAEGMDIAEAFDAVLGEGRFEALASDLYHALRERGETAAAR
jgi:hypothetical protein